MSKQNFWETQNMLWEAISKNDFNSFKLLISNEIDINSYNTPHSESIVFELTASHRYEMLQFLFDNKSTVDQSQIIKGFANQIRILSGNTVKELGISENYIKMVNILLPQIKDLNGKFFLNDQVGEITILEYLAFTYGSLSNLDGFVDILNNFGNQLSMDQIEKCCKILQDKSQRLTEFPQFAKAADYVDDYIEKQKLLNDLNKKMVETINLLDSISQEFAKADELMVEFSSLLHSADEIIPIISQQNSEIFELASSFTNHVSNDVLPLGADHVSKDVLPLGADHV